MSLCRSESGGRYLSPPTGSACCGQREPVAKVYSAREDGNRDSSSPSTLDSGLPSIAGRVLFGPPPLIWWVVVSPLDLGRSFDPVVHFRRCCKSDALDARGGRHGGGSDRLLFPVARSWGTACCMGAQSWSEPRVQIWRG